MRHTWPVQCSGKPVEVPIVSRMVSNNNSVLREAALAGMGVMMRASFTLGDDLAAGRLVRLLGDHCVGRLGVYMVYPSRRLLSAKVRAFTDFMVKSFPEPDADPWLKSL
jgi:DNA-binding transcriptional LysR family regulator